MCRQVYQLQPYLYRRDISSLGLNASSEHLHHTCIGGEGRVVRSLDPCSKGPGFETTFRPVIKCEERIGQLSVIPGKKAKGIRRCGHIERKDQGRTAQLVYLSSGLFVLCA